MIEIGESTDGMPQSFAELRAIVEDADRALKVIDRIPWRDKRDVLEDVRRQVADIADGLQQLDRRTAQQDERRHNIVANQQIDTTLWQMEQAVETLDLQLPRKSDILQEYRAAVAALEDVKAELLLSGTIDGKNAELRAAQLQLALRGNAQQRRVDDLKAQLDDCDATIEVARLQHGSAKARLAASTAVLQLYAS